MSAVDFGSVGAIAKKDFQDATRSWVFWGLSGLFFLLLVAVAGVISTFGGEIAEDGATTEALVFFVSQVTRLIIPFIAVILGWKAIAGERESGSLKVLLSLPHSRRDVILGKLLGRSAVLSLSLTVGFVLAATIVAVLLGGFDVIDYTGLLVISILYGVAYLAVAVGVSALTKSTTVAGAVLFGVILLFYVGWNVLSFLLLALSAREDLFFTTVEYTGSVGGETYTGERLQSGSIFIESLDPGQAYSNALSMTTSIEEGLIRSDWFSTTPFYLQDWFSFIILLLWAVIPLGLALYRFDRVDL